MMSSDMLMQRNLAEYLLKEDRMIVDPTPEMMRLFPMQTPEGDAALWLHAAARVLRDAVELRQPALPGKKPTLVVKDRAVLFNMTQERTLEDMAQERRKNQDA